MSGRARTRIVKAASCVFLCSVQRGGGRVLDWVWKVGGLDFWLRVCDLGLPDRAGAGRMAGCRPWGWSVGVGKRGQHVDGGRGAMAGVREGHAGRAWGMSPSIRATFEVSWSDLV
jgi:hypothetical protein